MVVTQQWKEIDIALFQPSVKDFWVHNLNNITIDFPLLEEIHRQSFYMILIIEKAIGKVHVNSQDIHLNQSALVILTKPNDIISISMETEVKGYIILFNERFFTLHYNKLNNLQLWKFSQKKFIRVNSISFVEKTILSVIEEQNSLLRGYNDIILSYLNVILNKLERLLPLSNATAINPNSSFKDQKMNEFLQLIELFFRTQKLPKFYAKKLHISTNYLNRICQQISFVASGKIIRDRVMLEAEKLLKHTSMDVIEIANFLGYENVSYFITYFKRHLGITPEKYRKINN